MKRIIYSSIAIANRFKVLFIIAVFISAANAKAQSYLISFVNNPPPTNIYQPDLDQNDHLDDPVGVPEDAIETGVRFRVSQPGTVTGIRFYKGQGVAGTHIGHLWSNTGGSPLAQATFSESGLGWQEVTVSVHISAGVNYVASVFNNLGDYAAEPYGSFNWDNAITPGQDFGTDPIRPILSSHDPGGNGLYKYLFNAMNPSGAFPNATPPTGVNYWIDVRFVPDFSLPVSLTDFKATTATNNISLSWKTEHEFYNKGFEIQRSNNGSDWYAINFINGAGESTVTKNYNYTDKALAPGTYYYRLKQVDLDGKNTFSAIVSASISGKGSVSLFQNYPNPFITSTSIRFDLPTAQHARLSLVDLAGREVKVLTDKVTEAGSHVVTLDAGNLSRQTYVLRLQTENGVLTRKILIK